MILTFEIYTLTTDIKTKQESRKISTTIKSSANQIFDNNFEHSDHNCKRGLLFYYTHNKQNEWHQQKVNIADWWCHKFERTVKSMYDQE